MTQTAAELSELIERVLIKRVELATGPDRELDADIMEALGHEVMRAGFWKYLHPDARRWVSIPMLTASLDAVLALVNEVLPGWNVVMTTFYRTAAVIPMDRNSYGQSDPRAGHANLATLPLSVLAALLRALKAKTK